MPDVVDMAIGTYTKKTANRCLNQRAENEARNRPMDALLAKNSRPRSKDRKQHHRAQRKKLRDTSYDDMVMGINISRVFSNTTYP